MCITLHRPHKFQDGVFILHIKHYSLIDIYAATIWQ